MRMTLLFILHSVGIGSIAVAFFMGGMLFAKVDPQRYTTPPVHATSDQTTRELKYWLCGVDRTAFDKCEVQ